MSEKLKMKQLVVEFACTCVSQNTEKFQEASDLCHEIMELLDRNHFKTRNDVILAALDMASYIVVDGVVSVAGRKKY